MSDSLRFSRLINSAAETQVDAITSTVHEADPVTVIPDTLCPQGDYYIHHVDQDSTPSNPEFESLYKDAPRTHYSAASCPSGKMTEPCTIERLHRI